MSKKETKTTENAQLYELGFHINPTLAEEGANAVFSKIKEVIINNNGEVVKEGALKLFKLCYTIVKKIEGVNTRFNTAYFGWVKFNAESSDIESIKKAMDSNVSVVRFIFVKTVDDYEHSTEKLAEAMVEEEPAAEESDVVVSEESAEVEPVTKEKDELDTALEEIVK